MGLAHSKTNRRERDPSRSSSQRIRRPQMHTNKHLSRSSSAILNQISNPNNSLWEASFDSDTLFTMNTTPSSTSENLTADQCQVINLDINEEGKVGNSTGKNKPLRRSKGNHTNNIHETVLSDHIHHYHCQSNVEQQISLSSEKTERSIYSEHDHDTSPKHRSQSPALPCLPPKKRPQFGSYNNLYIHEDDEHSIAHAELMYTQATWRMYNRIMKARTKAAELKAEEEMREKKGHQASNHSMRHVPIPLDLTNSEHQRGFCTETNSRMSHSTLQELGEPFSSYSDLNNNCRSDSFDHAPIIFYLEMES